MLLIYKYKKSEPVYTCGDCNTTWKNSWVEPRYLNDCCPFCFAPLDYASAKVIRPVVKKSLPPSELDPELKLRLGIDFLEGELMEKHHQLQITPSIVNGHLLTNEIDRVRNKIFSLRAKLVSLQKNQTERGKSVGTN